MQIELKDIKELRKKLNMTQLDLAIKSGVSQSLIAKVESGKLDPTYTNAKKIFDSLDNMRHENETKVSEIMTQKIFYVNSKSNIENAIAKMKKYKISQMPVIDGDIVVGFLSESIILEAIMNNKNKTNVCAIMEDSPPVLSKNANLNTVLYLLRSFPLVLISDKGKLNGVVTRSDILDKAYRRWFEYTISFSTTILLNKTNKTFM